MLDFTSALYLGLRHPATELGRWQALTTGRPAALGESTQALHAAGSLAQLQGCEDACLLPSTLHLFRDLFTLFAQAPIAILYDAGTYPIARAGIEAATAAGAVAAAFAHHDPLALERLARRMATAGLRPIVVTDGFCPGCGHVAPLRDYARIARAGGGTLVIDDTQALGILGANPGPSAPFGHGGAGAAAWAGISGRHVVIGTSLAKGFGAPLAVLCGNAELIGRFRAGSESRVHSSPPSAADVAAAARALAINREQGETLRARLRASVDRLRRWVARAAAATLPRLSFPVQGIAFARGFPLTAVHRALLRCGIRTLVTRACDGLARLTFIVTAAHRPADIDFAGRSLCRILEHPGGRVARPVETS